MWVLCIGNILKWLLNINKIIVAFTSVVPVSASSLLQVEEMEGLGGALLLRSNRVQRCPSNLSNHAYSVGERNNGTCVCLLELKVTKVYCDLVHFPVILLLQTLPLRACPAPPPPKTLAPPPQWRTGRSIAERRAWTRKGTRPSAKLMVKLSTLCFHIQKVPESKRQ